MTEQQTEKKKPGRKPRAPAGEPIAMAAKTLKDFDHRIRQLRAEVDAIRGGCRAMEEDRHDLARRFEELSTAIAAPASDTGDAPITLARESLKVTIETLVREKLDELALTVAHGTIDQMGDELRKVIREEIEAARKRNPVSR